MKKSNTKLTGKGLSDIEIQQKYPFAWNVIANERNKINDPKISKDYKATHMYEMKHYGSDMTEEKLKELNDKNTPAPPPKPYVYRGTPISEEEIQKQFPYAWEAITEQREILKRKDWGKGMDLETAKELESQRNPKMREERNKAPLKCDPKQKETGWCVENPDGSLSFPCPGCPEVEPCFVGRNYHGNETKEECARLNAVAYQRWYDSQSPINKFFDKVNNGLISIADSVLSLPIPGLNFVGDMYKTFAPPGSKYYQDGSIGDKLKGFVIDQGVNLAKQGAKKLIGLGLPREKNSIWLMAKASYDDAPMRNINGWSLIDSRPTLKFYRKGNEIVIAVRGTNPTDGDDLKADGLIAIGGLPSSARFQKDLRIIKEFQNKYPISQYSYSGVGHSLGGAIVDELIKQKLIRDGWTYNPAVNIGDFKKAIPNHRVYMDADPLYKMMGKHTKNPEVRKYKPKKGFISSLVSKIPKVGDAYVGLDAHKLDNFQGGIHSKFKKQLADMGLSEEQYLRHAKELAKRRGYDNTKIFFADDGVHKLTYKDDKRISHFGRVGYGDFIIWSWKEKKGEVPKGYAKKKQDTFWKSHSQIKGDWKQDPLSPNNLALKVLW